MHPHRYLRAARVLFQTLLLLALVSLVSTFSPPAHAFVGIIVDTTADNTTGGDTFCTLREAITNANSNSDTTSGDCPPGLAGADTITFSVSGTITLGSSLPNINDDVTIDGTGQTITVSGASLYQVMRVNSGKSLSLNTLTIANGKSINYGGGISNLGGTVNVTNSTFSGNSAPFGGGGIYNGGTVNVTNSTFSGNSAPLGVGGGIHTGLAVNVTNSTFSGNSASYGGGIFIELGSVNVTNSTFSGNSAPNGGGGISNDDTLNVTNSTFSGNSASNYGGGISNTNAATTTLRNSIIANNTGGDCYADAGSGGVVTADALNIDGDGSCDSATQKTTGEINLATLADNGGPTMTMALQSPSDAINAGDNTVCGNAVGAPDYGAGGVDQRGVIRPQNTTCDVGAYELLFCAAGSFDNGSATCAPAPAGYYADVDGLSSAIPCNPGYFQPNPGAVLCNQATAGNYVPASASTTQTPCPAGTTSGAGASFCTQTGASGFVVNDAADTDDGTCAVSPGNCTLREAINTANALSGDDTITFDIPDTGAECSSNNVCTITLGSILPNVTDNVTIDGAPNNGDVTVSGDNSVKILQVVNLETLNLNALTIANGFASSYGAGVYVNSGATLNVSNSTFSGNSLMTSVLQSGGAAIANAGGIVHVTNSTFSNNSFTVPVNCGPCGGVAILNLNGTLEVTNSTFSGNTFSSPGICNPQCGGTIRNNSGTTHVTNSTFSGNALVGNGVASTLNVAGGTFIVRNSILADSGGNSCYDSGTVLDADASNLAADATCDAATQKTVAEIDLQSLADNGGTTQTFALGNSSAAINAGDNAVCAAAVGSPNYGAGGLDQRGTVRPQGPTCDVGAYELVYTGFQTGPDFVVNSAADTDDSSCDLLEQGVGNQNCTLREAINAANMFAGANTITFDILDTGAECSINNICTITLSALGALPAIDDDVTIDGAPNSGKITVSGANLYRVMRVNSGITLNLNALAIVDGNVGTGMGGGIHNDGSLYVTNSSFSGNQVTNGGGGGIYNGNYLSVTNSTFSGNSGLDGGAIHTSGKLDVTNSTFSANSAKSFGGGAIISQIGDTVIINSTFSGNSGRTLFTNDGSIVLSNSIIANSTNGSNCQSTNGPITAGASNIADDTSCNSATQKTTAQIALGTLQNNGGTTETIELGNTSAAIDAGDDAVCAAAPVNALDQRGEARNDLNCDAGAFELQYGTTPPNNNTVTVQYDTNGSGHSFGPALAIITPTTGAPIAFTVTITPNPYTTPTPPANALPIQWDATASTSPFSAFITLCYDPNVLTGQDESTLHLYHWNGSTWQDFGGVLDNTTHLPYHCITSASPLTSLSPLALAPGAPTATNVTGVKGLVNKNGNIVLRWKTTSEAQIAGFNVYRQGKQGEWKQINAQFRQAKHAGAALGDKYRFIDRQANADKTYRYKIEIVYLDGHTEWTNVIRVNKP